MQVENLNNDDDCTLQTLSGISLNEPLRWEGKKYRLCMFVHDVFESHDRFNPLAPHICNSLKGCNNDMYIKGPALICNEDENKVLDMTNVPEIPVTGDQEAATL